MPPDLERSVESCEILSSAAGIARFRPLKTPTHKFGGQCPGCIGAVGFCLFTGASENEMAWRDTVLCG
jgi:hypothetical protein